MKVKKPSHHLLALLLCSALLVTLFSCDKGETYADMKKKERSAIDNFIRDNSMCGPITVISESTFEAQGYTTNLENNEFVRFDSDGIYLQIIRQGEGKTMDEMAQERDNGEISKPIVCRFIEYDIKNASVTNNNYYTESVADEMQCSYVHSARSYQAYFVSGGYMYAKYGSVVPTGWLKPLDYIRLTKVSGREAKVRVIVPHSSGTANASQYVLPFYYEISYQLPANR